MAWWHGLYSLKWFHPGSVFLYLTIMLDNCFSNFLYWTYVGSVVRENWICMYYFKVTLSVIIIKQQINIWAACASWYMGNEFINKILVDNYYSYFNISKQYKLLKIDWNKSSCVFYFYHLKITSWKLYSPEDIFNN